MSENGDLKPDVDPSTKKAVMDDDEETTKEQLRDELFQLKQKYELLRREHKDAQVQLGKNFTRRSTVTGFGVTEDQVLAVRQEQRRRSVHGVKLDGEAMLSTVNRDVVNQQGMRSLKLRKNDGYHMIIGNEDSDEEEEEDVNHSGSILSERSSNVDSAEKIIRESSLKNKSAKVAPLPPTRITDKVELNLLGPSNQENTHAAPEAPATEDPDETGKGMRRLWKKVRYGVIHPESRFRANWTILVLFMLLYLCVQVPFEVSFNTNLVGIFAVVDYLFNFLFFMDLVFNFRTGYYDYKFTPPAIVMNRKMIIKNYLTTWFVIDLISIFPFKWVIEGSLADTDTHNAEAITFTRLLRLLKLFRLVRLAGLWRYFRYWSERVKPGALRLVSLLLVMVLMMHLLACLFFFISDLDATNINTWSNDYDGVRYWDSPVDQYVVALYWSVTTMTTVGSGDIVPHNQTERLFLIFAMIVSCSLFAYFVGNMAHLISSVDSTMTLYKERMSFVREYMSHQELPTTLQHRIKAYYANCWKNLKSFPFSEDAILEDLSPALRREVVLFLNQDMVKKVPFFQSQDQTFICSLILAMQSEICAPLDFILRQGEIGKCMYFLRRGLVEVCNKDATEVYTILSDGAYFGEVSLLVSGRRTASVRAIFHCSLLRLEQEDLDEILLDYPDAMETIIKLAATSKYQLSEDERRALQSRFNMVQIDESLRNSFSDISEEEEGGELGQKRSRRSLSFKKPSLNRGHTTASLQASATTLPPASASSPAPTGKSGAMITSRSRRSLDDGN